MAEVVSAIAQQREIRKCVLISWLDGAPVSEEEENPNIYGGEEGCKKKKKSTLISSILTYLSH